MIIISIPQDGISQKSKSSINYSPVLMYSGTTRNRIRYMNFVVTKISLDKLLDNSLDKS